MQSIIGKRFLQFIFLFTFTFSFAQEKELDKAAKKFESYAFIDAQKIYLRLAGEGYESAELFKKLGFQKDLFSLEVKRNISHEDFAQFILESYSSHQRE